MVQGAKHMKSNNAADNGGSEALSPNPSAAASTAAALGRPAHHHRHHPYWRGPYDLAVDLGPAQYRACSTRSAPCPAPWMRCLKRSVSASCSRRAPITSSWRSEATELPADQESDPTPAAHL